MGGFQFDRVSRLFAGRRREFTKWGERTVFAEKFIAAQAATPEPDAAHGPEMLFLQSFQSGSIAAKEGTDGRYIVTLEYGLGQTIYFSDRPNRIVGANPTPQFLGSLGFPDDNPPNAALLVETADGTTEIAVMELFNPIYDETSHTATYEVEVLAQWENSADLGFTEAAGDLAELAPSFGASHLFIDGCPDGVITCRSMSGFTGSFDSSIFDGFCYSEVDRVCLPCQPWNTTVYDAFGFWRQMCNSYFSKCNGECQPMGVTRLEN